MLLNYLATLKLPACLVETKLSLYCHSDGVDIHLDNGFESVATVVVVVASALWKHPPRALPLVAVLLPVPQKLSLSLSSPGSDTDSETGKASLCCQLSTGSSFPAHIIFLSVFYESRRAVHNRHNERESLMYSLHKNSNSGKWLQTFYSGGGQWEVITNFLLGWGTVINVCKDSAGPTLDGPHCKRWTYLNKWELAEEDTRLDSALA